MTGTDLFEIVVCVLLAGIASELGNIRRLLSKGLTAWKFHHPTPMNVQEVVWQREMDEDIRRRSAPPTAPPTVPPSLTPDATAQAFLRGEVDASGTPLVKGGAQGTKWTRGDDV
jgi:hypothetical protein